MQTFFFFLNFYFFLKICYFNWQEKVIQRKTRSSFLERGVCKVLQGWKEHDNHGVQKECWGHHRQNCGEWINNEIEIEAGIKIFRYSWTIVWDLHFVLKIQEVLDRKLTSTTTLKWIQNVVLGLRYNHDAAMTTHDSKP